MDERICLKKYVNQKEYEELLKLEALCGEKDGTNLKLELEYQVKRDQKEEKGMNSIHQFLYYIDEQIVGYLGISSFGGSDVAEINGCVHPDFRRRGIFKKLFELAAEECSKRNYSKVLLISDGKAKAAISFIEAVGGEYAFSEYRMKRTGEVDYEAGPLKLRKATNLDGKEIVRQDAIYFNHGMVADYECFPEEDEKRGKFIYIAEVEGKIVGKLNIFYEDGYAFIGGVGVLPEYRSKGYGKAELKEALKIISDKGIEIVELDVEAKNSNALNLYKGVGFIEQSVMNYYEFVGKK